MERRYLEERGGGGRIILQWNLRVRFSGQEVKEDFENRVQQRTLVLVVMILEVLQEYYMRA